MKEETDANHPIKDGKLTPSLLEAFDLLRVPKDNEKLTGGAKILSQLRGEEGDKEVQYVLKRLIRSLGANVPEARTGYFATLVALLTKFEKINVKQLFALTKIELHANGSSKSEVGDVALGIILVCGAIFRSGLMLRGSEENQKEVIQHLLNASKKKSYLTTVAYLILLDFVNQLHEEQFSTIIWPHLKPECKKDVKEHSLDSLHFLMVVSKKFPNKVKLRKLIGVADVLCEDTLQDVCEKIMGGIDFNSISHPIYKEIGTQIANSPLLQQFWSKGIDSQLAKHNRNRELVAINILTTVLNNIKDNVEVIPELLSRNFFKLFMDWFKGLQTASKIRNMRDNEDDHKIMIKKEKELLNALGKGLKSEQVDTTIRIAVLKKLLFNPGEMNFTEITGTTILKVIISDLDKDGVKKMAKLLKGVLLNSSKKTVKDGVERSWYNNERLKAAELISYLVSHESVKDDTEFKLNFMKILMCFGFFKIGSADDENVVISSELSGDIKSCFYRCFTSRFSNVDNLATVLSSLSSFICSIMKKEEVRKKMEKRFPEENMECWNMLTEVCQSIQKIEVKSKVDKVFLILLYQLGLFLFSEPSYVKMATSSIKELKSCYEHYRKSKKKKVEKVPEDLTGEPEWIEVLVEVLLSILSAESSVLRSVVQCVFRLLTEYLTPSSIGQIVSVLDPDNESDPLTQSDSENDESDSEDNEEDGETKSESEKEDDEEDDSDSDIEDDDDNEDMKTPEQLRMAVQQALGAAAESDNESIDADIIDEEEGKRLDLALAEAFKQFQQGKGKKKKDRKDKKALSDFRIRVLDLIDIYLEKEPSMDICLGMIAPLTRCLEFCLADNQFRELENRVRKTIKIMTKIKKFTSTDDISIDTLCDYLKTVIDKGSRSHFMYQALGDVITNYATFIIHCSQKIEGKAPKSLKKAKSPLLGIFKECVRSYFQNRSCMLPIIFFHNVLQTEWEGNYELVPLIIEKIFDKDVRQFRRNEGLELVTGFFRSLNRLKPDSEKLLNKITKIENGFVILLTNALKGDGFEAKNNFFVVTRKLVNIMKTFHESCHVKTSIDFKSLFDNISSNKGSVTIKNDKKQVQHGNKNSVVDQHSKNSKKKNKRKRQLEQTNGHAEPHQKKVRNDSNQSD